MQAAAPAVEARALWPNLSEEAWRGSLMSAAAHADRRTRGRGQQQQQQQVFDMEEPAVMPGEDLRMNHEVSSSGEASRSRASG